jgi:excinuclease UvrABC helicase subunit UvrB
MITHNKREMERMAKNLNFMEAARLRDELQKLQDELKKKWEKWQRALTL